MPDCGVQRLAHQTLWSKGPSGELQLLWTFFFLCLWVGLILTVVPLLGQVVFSVISSSNIGEMQCRMLMCDHIRCDWINLYPFASMQASASEVCLLIPPLQVFLQVLNSAIPTLSPKSFDPRTMTMKRPYSPVVQPSRTPSCLAQLTSFATRVDRLPPPRRPCSPPGVLGSLGLVTEAVYYWRFHFAKRLATTLVLYVPPHPKLALSSYGSGTPSLHQFLNFESIEFGFNDLMPSRFSSVCYAWLIVVTVRFCGDPSCIRFTWPSDSLLLAHNRLRSCCEKTSWSCSCFR